MFTATINAEEALALMKLRGIEDKVLEHLCQERMRLADVETGPWPAVNGVEQEGELVSSLKQYSTQLDIAIEQRLSRKDVGKKKTV